MSALALLNTLGSAGAAAGENRQLSQEQQFKGGLAAQQLALHLAALQKQTQIEEALGRYRQAEATRPDWTPAREPYQGDDGKWYQDILDRRSGKIIRTPVGTPLSNVNTTTRDTDTLARQKALEDQKAQLAIQLESSRAKHAKELAQFRAAYPSAGRSGAAGSVPLAASRWYKTLGGSRVDDQIKVLEGMLRSMQLTSIGAPEQLYQNQLYVKTQQQLAQLYQQADGIMAQAMQRAGGATSNTPPPAKGGSIVVSPEDMNH